MTARVQQLDGGVTVVEEPRSLPVSATADVIVLGGGVAGLSAALAQRT